MNRDKRKHLEDYYLRDVVNSARSVSQTGLMLPSALAQPSQQQSKVCSDWFHLTSFLSVFFEPVFTAQTI